MTGIQRSAIPTVVYQHLEDAAALRLVRAVLSRLRRYLLAPPTTRTTTTLCSTRMQRTVPSTRSHSDAAGARIISAPRWDADALVQLGQTAARGGVADGTKHFPH